jgi:hypothetical protein
VPPGPNQASRGPWMLFAACWRRSAGATARPRRAHEVVLEIGRQRNEPIALQVNVAAHAEPPELVVIGWPLTSPLRKASAIA